MIVVDLGAAPGSWSQIAAKLVQPKGRVIALDLLPMEPLPHVEFIQGDFSEDKVLQVLLASVPADLDWVISDMAPNMSGNASIDIPRSMELAELALDFALQTLNIQGGLLIKVLQGEGFDHLLATVKRHFKSVTLRKPKASRGRSREVYVLARGLKR